MALPMACDGGAAVLAALGASMALVLAAVWKAARRPPDDWPDCDAHYRPDCAACRRPADGYSRTGRPFCRHCAGEWDIPLRVPGPDPDRPPPPPSDYTPHPED